MLVTPGFLSIWLSSTYALAQTTNPCELYSKADAEALLNEKVSAGVTSDAITPAGKSCLYKFIKKGEAYSLKVSVSDDFALKNEGIFDSTTAVMARQEKAREKMITRQNNLKKFLIWATTLFGQEPRFGYEKVKHWL